MDYNKKMVEMLDETLKKEYMRGFSDGQNKGGYLDPKSAPKDGSPFIMVIELHGQTWMSHKVCIGYWLQRKSKTAQSGWRHSYWGTGQFLNEHEEFVGWMPFPDFGGKAFTDYQGKLPGQTILRKE